jgi:hypothetical protein
MKGYIYITGNGTDPGARQNLNDPLFAKIPTLGACMPNVRRIVVRGDYVFVVSGKVPGVQQYVVGGLRVEEKIDALAAYGRFPENHLRMGLDGLLKGNVIVNADGTQHALDRHSSETFANRVKNFVVGSDPISLETEREIALGREQTLEKLSDILGRRGNRVIDVVSRWSKLDDGQVNDLLNWLRGLKEKPPSMARGFRKVGPELPTEGGRMRLLWA